MIPIYVLIILLLTAGNVIYFLENVFMNKQTVNRTVMSGSITSNAKWIWSASTNPAPQNRFTYFRKVVALASLPQDATLHFAADSNAQLWINGVPLRRKVARYHEEKITAEVVNAGPYLHEGKNVVVVLHHNWGDIVTFQRTGNRHAGLYVQGSWLATDDTWKALTAPQFLPHESQIIGIAGNAPRIRYPIVYDVKNDLCDLHQASFNDSSWSTAFEVSDGPWQPVPTDVEIPGQRETPVRPHGVVAAGRLIPAQPLSDDPYSISLGIRKAQCLPEEGLTESAKQLLSGGTLTLSGKAGESRYVTFDFHLPVHGYPFLQMESSTDGLVVDLGYGEIVRALYDDKVHVDLNGWVNTEGIVGKGYADRVLTRKGSQSLELPDERTARWLTLHIHFPVAGSLTFQAVGMIKSQYPITPLGSFQCGDEQIDQIVRLCLIHAEVTMIDAYVDTPGREDGQWLEDDRPRAQIAERWFGDHQLRQLLIRTVAESQGEDGHVHPFPPSNYPSYPAAIDWSLQWIACIYDEFMWTRDTEYLQRYWEHYCCYVERILSYVNSEGVFLTNHLLGDIRVGVHPQGMHQSSGVVTPWVIERLHWSAQMADAMGQTAQATEWRDKAKLMTDAFRKYHVIPSSEGVPLHIADCYDPEGKLHERGFSQAGHSTAITCGLLAPNEALAVLNYAFPPPDGTPPVGVTRWNNPTWCQRILLALSENGLAERAIAHLKERYAPYLPGNPRNKTPLPLQGPLGGPLPEYWVTREDWNLKEGELDTAQPEDETGSHGWGSVPLLWFHESLLGVRVTEPGGGKLHIAPNAAGLPYVAGHTMTPQGSVWVCWDPQAQLLEVAIPTGVVAEVSFPGNPPSQRIQALQSAGQVEDLGAGTMRIQTGGQYTWQRS